MKDFCVYKPCARVERKVLSVLTNYASANATCEV